MKEQSRSITVIELLTVVPFAVKMLWKQSRLFFLLLLLLTIGSGFSSAAVVWISKYVIDAIVAVVASGGGITELYHALHIYGYEFLIAACFMLAGVMNNYIGTLLAGKLALYMNSDLLERLSKFDMSSFDDPEFYDMASRALAESGSKPLTVIQEITGGISSLITFGTMSLLLAAFYWPLVPIVVVFSLPYLVIKLKFGRMFYNIQYGRTQDGRLAGFLSSCMLNRRYIPEILSFGLWDFLRGEWYSYAKRFFSQDVRLARKRSVAEATVSVVLTISKTMAAVYILYRGVTAAKLTVGEIFMYGSAYAGALKALGRSFDHVSGLYSAALFLRNYLTFTEISPPERSLSNAVAAPEAIHTVEIRNVSFMYPGSTTYTLRDVNITFKSGQSTLIVGVNGAGKTTLIKLLLRLYDPTEGQILINGIDIRRFDPHSLQRRMAAIFQDFLRYPFTAARNIGIGCVDEIDNADRIRRAARTAKADDLIRRLPNSYDTYLSRQFSDGVDLSLGQWQRVCLARLFMRDTPIQIFDEPTASLDVETEAELLREISRLSVSKLCILVSHRMLRADVADRIAVMENGHVIEDGNHHELLRKNGSYARLWNLYHSIGRKNQEERSASLV